MERRARVAVVAPAVPGREERNGFSARLHDFLLALLEVADVDLFLPRTSAADSPDAIQYWHAFDALTLHLVLDTRTRSPIVHTAQRAVHHLFGRLPRWSVPRHVPELARHLEEGRADVLCLHLPVTAHLAFLAPDDLPVVAVLEEGLERGIFAPVERTWLHSVGARREQRRVRGLYERVGRRASRVVVISSEEGAHFVETGIDPDRVVVVRRGIDVSYFSPDVSHAEPGLDSDVAVFGDFHFARNLDPARDAARWAAAHEPDLRWAFVGDIDDRDADALGAEGVVTTGRVDDLRSSYSSAKVVLVPSVEVTGVKTTLVQAWAMGRPVVSTPESARGLPAVDGTNVLVGRTTSELVERCAQLVGSPDLRAELGAAGRRTAENELDGEKIAAEFAALVMSVAAVR